jgi:SAM-dependent methyltransferase
MGLWTERVVPHLTDLALRGQDIVELRAEACAGLRGRVLELGFGSGLNLPHLPPGVELVHAVEPSDVGWRMSEARRRASAVGVERSGLDGQRLAEPDAGVDSALVTFSLCTIPDPVLALREVARVLRPGGQVHFVEHGLAPEPGVARWQRRLDPLEQRVFGGCHLTRDVPAMVAEAGLTMDEVTASYLPGPRVARPWVYCYRGSATNRR